MLLPFFKTDPLSAKLFQKWNYNYSISPIQAIKKIISAAIRN